MQARSIGSRRRRFASLRPLSTLTLLLAGLLFCVAPAAADGPASAAIAPSVEGGRDPWLHGPALRLYPTAGRLRPFVVGGAGLLSESARLGIETPTHRLGDVPYAGRVGAGLDLRLDPRSSLRVEGSYLQADGVEEDAATGTVGLKLEVRF